MIAKSGVATTTLLGLFLTFLPLTVLASPKGKITFNDAISCPDPGIAATGVLIYFHGLFRGSRPGRFHYVDEKSSREVLQSELRDIRVRMPGTIGVHVGGGNPWSRNPPRGLQQILEEVRTACGIPTSGMTVILAGHSDGGRPVQDNANANVAGLIFLDAIYFAPQSLSQQCAKISVVGGPETVKRSRELRLVCSEVPGFRYLDVYAPSPRSTGHRTGISAIDHYATIGYLSDLFLERIELAEKSRGRP